MTTIQVLGVPAPQGSKTVFNGHVVEGGSAAGRAKHRAWRNDVAWAARAAWAGQPPLDEPVSITLSFVLPRPSSTRKGAVWQAKKPDLDKLIRSTLDGLTEAGVLIDDARVSELLTTKRLADPADPWTGASITIRSLVTT